jgi:hypothetical protein
MEKIVLYTRGGDEVTTVSVMPMTPMPEGILWGSRVFFRDQDNVYREGMLWSDPSTIAVIPVNQLSDEQIGNYVERAYDLQTAWQDRTIYPTVNDYKDALVVFLSAFQTELRKSQEFTPE